MLVCENYKMFYGSATVTPKTDAVKPIEIVGTWLYKPDTDCWYVNGCSFVADVVGNFIEYGGRVQEVIVH